MFEYYNLTLILSQSYFPFAHLSMCIVTILLQSYLSLNLLFAHLLIHFVTILTQSYFTHCSSSNSYCYKLTSQSYFTPCSSANAYCDNLTSILSQSYFPLCSPHTAPEADAGLIWVPRRNSTGIWNYDANALRKCKN